jgi:putative SOS response-associated peptidase YedK
MTAPDPIAAPASILQPRGPVRPVGRHTDGGVLNFAGLWDRWKNPDTSETTMSCTIIVTDANTLTRPIHDRMPVLLDKADIESWLNGTGGTPLLNKVLQ